MSHYSRVLLCVPIGALIIVSLGCGGCGGGKVQQEAVLKTSNSDINKDTVISTKWSP
ncbi:MAG: hypothetical protein IPL08_05430 [Saprospiraceae bacterium]|nr:hypothetical protein [Saprospiraceae bacterium]